MENAPTNLGPKTRWRQRCAMVSQLRRGGPVRSTWAAACGPRWGDRRTLPSAGENIQAWKSRGSAETGEEPQRATSCFALHAGRVISTPSACATHRRCPRHLCGSKVYREQPPDRGGWLGGPATCPCSGATWSMWPNGPCAMPAEAPATNCGPVADRRKPVPVKASACGQRCRQTVLVARPLPRFPEGSTVMIRVLPCR